MSPPPPSRPPVKPGTACGDARGSLKGLNRHRRARDLVCPECRDAKQAADAQRVPSFAPGEACQELKGTFRGAFRHYEWGERPCPACRRARSRVDAQNSEHRRYNRMYSVALTTLVQRHPEEYRALRADGLTAYRARATLRDRYPREFWPALDDALLLDLPEEE